MNQIQYYCECQEEFGTGASNILFENVYLNSWVNIEASVHLSTKKGPKVCLSDTDVCLDQCGEPWGEWNVWIYHSEGDAFCWYLGRNKGKFRELHTNGHVE